MNTPRNTRRTSPLRSDSESSDSYIEPDAISPRHPNHIYIENQERANSELRSLTNRLEELALSGFPQRDFTMATQTLSTADIQRLAEQAALACHDHGQIIGNMGTVIATSLKDSLENMTFNLPPAAPTAPKISDLKLPEIATKDGKIDVFSLLSFETDVLNLITSIDPDNKIEDRRWCTYILANFKEPAKKALVSIKPAEYATVKLFLAEVRNKLSGADVKVVARSKFKQLTMGDKDVNAFLAELQYLQIIGWDENDRSQADLINQIMIGIPEKWRNSSIRHLGGLPKTFDEARQMILRVQGEEIYISTYGSGQIPNQTSILPVTPSQPTVTASPAVPTQPPSSSSLPGSGPGPMDWSNLNFRGRGGRFTYRPRFQHRGAQHGFRGRPNPRFNRRPNSRGRGGEGPPRNQRQRGRGRGGRGRRIIKCYNCDKFGDHMAKDCKEPKKTPLYYQQLSWLDEYNDDTYEYDDSYYDYYNDQSYDDQYYDDQYHDDYYYDDPYYESNHYESQEPNVEQSQDESKN